MEEVTFRPYDTANYLRDEEDIAAYLEAVASDRDPAALRLALATAARARSMLQLARDAGMTQEDLAKVLGPEGDPSWGTVMKVLDALGLELSIRPKAA